MDIFEIAKRIAPLDTHYQEKARKRQVQLTKPIGSLGRLEDLSIQLAGIYRTERPTIGRKIIFTFAGDHGITSEGVSAYPSKVTAQMVLNFANGGAAINVLGRHVGADVKTVDIGVDIETSWPEGVLDRKVRRGTRNMVKDRAMTSSEALQALSTGADLGIEAIEKGANLIGVGEMGIGNTASASALTAIFTGNSVSEVTGRGTGIDDASLERKIRKIQEAIDLHNPDPNNPLDVLECVGGLEIAGMAGMIIGASSKSVPVVLDGFISSSAALVAGSLATLSRSYMIASHKSVEKGHDIILRHLGLEPLFDLRMRLGEGTGAALAMTIIEGSCKILNEMATFESAGIAKKGDD